MAESLRDIRIFVAAYEERSFTAAAVREHATQSGVSQHIRKLEEGFRVKLFNREKGQVAPTPAADAYYSRCIQILRNIESSNDAMRAFTGISGAVFVGNDLTEFGMADCGMIPDLCNRLPHCAPWIRRQQ